MSKQCSNCGANHEKLNIYSCNIEKCRGEVFYHIDFNDGIKVMYDTRYDGSWNWGIVLDPMDAQQYNKNEYIWILTTSGENIIYWSRKYDYNFIKLFSTYYVITYHKNNKNNKKITSKLYSININKILICGLNFYLINNNRCHNDSRSKYQDYNTPQGGVGMYALVIIQRYWLKTLEAKRHNEKYRNYVYKIFKNSRCKEKNCIKYIIKYL